MRTVWYCPSGYQKLCLLLHMEFVLVDSSALIKSRKGSKTYFIKQGIFVYDR